jgi:hypothetical protein
MRNLWINVGLNRNWVEYRDSLAFDQKGAKNIEIETLKIRYKDTMFEQGLIVFKHKYSVTCQLGY